jgi:hypothetical protein
MRKVLIVFICLFVLLNTAACLTRKTTGSEPAATTTSQATTVESASTTTVATPTSTTALPTTTAPAVTTAPPVTTAAPTLAPTTAATGISPTNTADMYSSYAFMVSYDPARGWADFDYFTMLRGEEAVQWLVAHEGRTLAEAQAEVAGFADSEFVLKNTNPQLRTIDLRSIPLKLMYYPDGTQVAGAEAVDSTLIDLYNLYSVDPAKVLDSFFYYVTVTGGVVVSVEQVYWP